MNEEMQELQQRLLQMLVSFREFTSENGLDFFLVGGSALGAYRHQGFIPWDDDVDIAMMRSDFEKMEQLMKERDNLLGEFIYSPVEQALIPEAPIGHLYDEAYASYGYENTAKLDIHPIDGVPEDVRLRKRQKIASLIYYLADYRHPVKNKGRVIREISKIILFITPNRLLDLCMRKCKRYITQWSDMTSAHICSLFGVAGYEREIMPRAYLIPLQTVPFENEEFKIPGDIDPYLRQLYGDYYILPPEEERIPRHDMYRIYQKDRVE